MCYLIPLSTDTRQIDLYEAKGTKMRQARSFVRTIIIVSVSALLPQLTNADDDGGKTAPVVIEPLSHAMFCGWSSDSKIVYLCGEKIEARRLSDGTEVAVQSIGYIPSAVEVAPNGKWIAIGGRYELTPSFDVPSPKIALHDAKTLKVAHEVDADARVHALAFSKDGRKLAAGLGDGRIQVFEVPTLKKLITAKLHSFKVISLDLSSDDIIASAAEPFDFSLCLSSLTRRQLKRIVPPEGVWRGQALAFFPDGDRLASLGQRAVSIWDVKSGKETIAIDVGDARGMCVSPDGKLIATVGRKISVWDPATGKELRRAKAFDLTAASLEFSRNGEWIAAAVAGESRIWKVETLIQRKDP